MKAQIAFFKGEFIPYDKANLHITTHALHYGTSIFEGIRGNWNKDDKTLYVFRIKEHFDRLLEGCKMLMIDIPYNSEDLCKITIELLAKNNFKEINSNYVSNTLSYKILSNLPRLFLEILFIFSLVIVTFTAYLFAYEFDKLLELLPAITNNPVVVNPLDVSY